jgi:hypothetical protein
MDDWLALESWERRDIFLKTIWGEDYEDRFIRRPVTETPWDGVTVIHGSFMSPFELELFTYTVFDFNPFLLADGNSYILTIMDGFAIDMKKVPEVYSHLQFFHHPDKTVVTGHRNGSSFSLDFRPN